MSAHMAIHVCMPTHTSAADGLPFMAIHMPMECLLAETVFEFHDPRCVFINAVGLCIDVRMQQVHGQEYGHVRRHHVQRLCDACIAAVVCSNGHQ